MTTPSKTELMSRLGTFRPSDRTHIANALNSADGKIIAIDAIKEFVAVWEKANWLEAYSIERIGKWVAKYQKDDVIETLSEWAKTRPIKARQKAGPALLQGIKIGKEQKVHEYA